MRSNNMKTASKLAVIALSAACLGIFIATPTRGDATTQPSDAAAAQSATGSISGTVTKDGKPLADAKVGLIVRQHEGKKGKNGTVGNDAPSTASTQPSEGGKGH